MGKKGEAVAGCDSVELHQICHSCAIYGENEGIEDSWEKAVYEPNLGRSLLTGSVGVGAGDR